MSRFSIVSALSIFVSVFAMSIAFAQESFSDILGRTLSNERGSIVINANGTITGMFGDNEFNATWDVEGGMFYRQGTLGDRVIERACQTIRIRNGQVSFVNADGTSQSPYTIQ